MGVQILQSEQAILEGEVTTHCKVYGHSAVIHAKSAELIAMPFGLWAWMGPRNCVRWGPDPPWDGDNLKGGKGWPIVKYSDTRPWSVQKWLNQSICCVGCGIWWAEGSTVQSYLPGGASVSSWEGTLAPPGEKIEPFVCCYVAALCQITLTTCYY